jgi:diguanylate cyclase (GGDEF)-like protein
MSVDVSAQDQRETSNPISREVFDRSLLRAINEASPDGILVVDDRGMVVSYNQRFIDIWQLDMNIVQANTLTDGTIPENKMMYAAFALLKYPEPFIKRVVELYANPWERDYCEIELNDGRTLERHSVGLHADGDHYYGRVWFFRDVTERKRGEAALRELACRDPLTGELNRGHFMERAAEEQERAKRHKKPLGVLMLDLDYFKSINDRFGHAAGDKVLETVCKRWRSVLRNADLLGRLGGEEFAILLPDSDWDATLLVAERLRSSIADQPVYDGVTEIFCTVSGGVTLLSPTDASIEDALYRADIALYRAKNQGRNRMEYNP